ncbi:MAG TPA: TolC family protein, partial [Sediminibacterium sp.]|nr:TolC family protein [Sediminibacterium sp.]
MDAISEERTNDSLMKISFTLFFLVICCTSSILKGQSPSDTLHLSIQEAEKRFIDSNYLLLASRYNVDAQKALTEQARLWDNPVLNTDQVLMANGKAFPYGKNPDGSYSGQYFIQVQQLIKTAGKRGKLMHLSNTNVKISEWELQDVLRNLRYQLHIDYYTISQQLTVLQVYREQQNQLTKLLNGMQAELQEGNIARKDYIRLQALQLSLQQDMTDLQKNIADNETDLKTLLSVTGNQFIVPTDPLPVQAADVPGMDSITRAGQTNNPYYQLQVTQTLFQQQNLSYQKALRVPDITLGPNFDRNSNFAPNYIGLGISLPLPLLNKNQGNI